MGSDAAAYREVNECGAVVEAGVVVEQLYVAGLQDHFQAQLARGRQLVEQRHRLVVGRRQPRHLLETLAQQVVVVRVVDAQVALLTHHSILSMLIICFNITLKRQLTVKHDPSLQSQQSGGPQHKLPSPSVAYRARQQSQK